jgi:Mg-chelatase subunit ChlD
MKSLARSVLSILLVAGLAPAAFGQVGELQVEIHEPASNLLLTSLEDSIEVEGGASIFGGVKYLDLFLVLDTSKSLQRTDPRDYRSAGAIGLVRHLPAKSDIQVGVVAFDRNAELLAPLTPNRSAIVAALRRLDRKGATDLAAGIHKALEGFDQNAREESSRVMLVFTDGKSDADEAREAMEEARRRGVAIHTLLLGSDRKGAEILGEIASGTGGTFLRVTDPARLPEAFLNLRTTGVERVVLRVNDSAPIATDLTGGTFVGRVPLKIGENRIVATATSLDGETRDDEVSVIVSGSLNVSIEAPFDGTHYTERRTEVSVEGTVSLFEDAPEGFLVDHPDQGVQRVVLRVDDSPPFATTLSEGRFQGRVLLHEGPNRIVATATCNDGRVADDAVTVTMRPPGCGELEVVARRDGKAALSISDRAVEVVFDASNSMWGRMQGRPKMSIAKEILQDALDWLPRDLTLALRVYGHQHGRELRNCADSQLMVPFAAGNRGNIRQAISAFRPRGQTPLAYSLQQVAQDFAAVEGERAVVLVTDGIESCGGDPVAAARALHERNGIPVHVIGFGLGGDGDEDLGSLRAIAEVSGGRFLTARSADELREALSVTVGTSYRVWRGPTPVAAGTLGAGDVIRLPAGDYTLRLDSTPPHEVPLRLASEENVTLILEREGSAVAHDWTRSAVAYTSCEAEVQARTPDWSGGEDELQSPASDRGH